QGDLDLSGYRYGPNADRTSTTGSGEPLALTIRASGDLTINGSITDGFGVPNTSRDESNFPGRVYGQGQVNVPGWTIVDMNLSHDGPIGHWDGDIWDFEFSVAITLTRDWTVPAGYFWGSGVYDSSGKFYRNGDTVPAGTTLTKTGDW